MKTCTYCGGENTTRSAKFCSKKCYGDSYREAREEQPKNKTKVAPAKIKPSKVKKPARFSQVTFEYDREKNYHMNMKPLTEWASKNGYKIVGVIVGERVISLNLAEGDKDAK